jgi:hypothetical protein
MASPLPDEAASGIFKHGSGAAKKPAPGVLRSSGPGVRPGTPTKAGASHGSQSAGGKGSFSTPRPASPRGLTPHAAGLIRALTTADSSQLTGSLVTSVSLPALNTAPQQQPTSPVAARQQPASPEQPPPEKPAEQAVCVALHIRPLVDREVMEGCANLLEVSPDRPEVRAPVGLPSAAAQLGWVWHSTAGPCRT